MTSDHISHSCLFLDTQKIRFSLNVRVNFAGTSTAANFLTLNNFPFLRHLQPESCWLFWLAECYLRVTGRLRSGISQILG